MHARLKFHRSGSDSSLVDQSSGVRSGGRAVADAHTRGRSIMMRSSSKRKIAAAMTSSGGCHKRKKATESGSGSLLPEEMITEVLVRLPVKSILRFRAVCRSWAALFATDDFCTLHMAAAPPRILYVSPSTARSSDSSSSTSTELYSRSPSSSSSSDDLLFTIDDTACGTSMQVVMPAPCHGLTLLFDATAPAYYICNAATRGTVARLPPPPHGAAVLYASTGLGFDARARKYKVVRLMRGALQCEVYTHEHEGGSSWRPPTGGGRIPFPLGRLVSNAVANATFYSIPPVFANGFLHWLLQPAFNLWPRAGVVSFSVADETFATVGPPPFWTFQPFEGGIIPTYPIIGSLGEHLLEMDNQLCLVRDLRYDPCGGCSLEIWKLSDYSSTGVWSLNHRVSFSGRVATELRQPQVVRVIGFTGNGGVSAGNRKMIIATSEHRIYDEYMKKVYTYDLSSRYLKTILSVTETHPLLPLPGGMYPSSRFSLIQESLALVHKTVSLSTTTTLSPS